MAARLPSRFSPGYVRWPYESQNWMLSEKAPDLRGRTHPVSFAYTRKQASLISSDKLKGTPGGPFWVVGMLYG